MTEPHFAGALLDATIFTARNGQPSLRLADRALMSAYDPGREAANKAQAIAASRICLVGLGLGYLADAFGERLVRVVVFPGEIERYLAVHAVEATSRAWGDRVQSVESVEEAGASIETSVRGGVAVVLDPATSADPALAAAMKDYSCVNNFLQIRLKKPFDSFTKLKKVFIKIVTLKLHIFKK